jgi:predicted nucleic acid-binding protein
MIIGDYSAVLDACVLHPFWLRGALLEIAEARLFRPLWSKLILDEWQASLARRYPHQTTEQHDKRRKWITDSFEDAMVEIPQELLDFDQKLLPDPKDNHVLWAAVCGHADAIVTSNVKDFPADIMREFELEVRHPDDFLLDIMTLDGQRAVSALQQHRGTMKKPELTAEQYVERAAACQLFQTHLKLLDFLDVL